MFGLDGGGAVVLLTAIFSWIVTLILAMLPKAQPFTEPKPADPAHLND